MTAWALIVGINEYPAMTGLSALQGAVADAADFADWALDPKGGAVDPAELRFWTHPAPADPSPALAQYLQAPPPWPTGAPDLTRAPRLTEIKNAAFDLATRAADAGVHRLYIFFAGHGVQTAPLSYDDDPQTCFVTADYTLAFPADGVIACDDLRRAMMRYGPTEVVLFFDCCRSALPVNQTRPMFGGPQFNPMGINLGCGVGNAAAPGLQAYETPVDAPTRGAFSKLLIHGLRQLRENGQLTADRLEAFLLAGIGKLTSPYSQRPTIQVHPHGYPLVLANGPPLGRDADLVIDATARPPHNPILLRWPDLSTTVVTIDEVMKVPAPPGTYSLETPQSEVLEVVVHTGPEDTHVVLN